MKLVHFFSGYAKWFHIFGQSNHTVFDGIPCADFNRGRRRLRAICSSARFLHNACDGDLHFYGRFGQIQPVGLPNCCGQCIKSFTYFDCGREPVDSPVATRRSTVTSGIHRQPAHISTFVISSSLVDIQFIFVNIHSDIFSTLLNLCIRVCEKCYRISIDCSAGY